MFKHNSRSKVATAVGTIAAAKLLTRPMISTALAATGGYLAYRMLRRGRRRRQEQRGQYGHSAGR
jgi:hypothetical protein